MVDYLEKITRLHQINSVGLVQILDTRYYDYIKQKDRKNIT